MSTNVMGFRKITNIFLHSDFGDKSRPQSIIIFLIFFRYGIQPDDLITITSFLPFQLRIQAQDGGSPSKFAEKTCKVTVNRNYKPPIFTTASLTGTQGVAETQNLGIEIKKLLAIDGDKQVSHRIYSRTSLPRTPLD
jgi:hypothetical protein